MSQFNAPAYEVAKPTGVCDKTGRSLEPGETYYAALAEIPEDQIERDENGRPRADQALGMHRVDVCGEAWDAGHRPDGLFSFWKTTVPEADEKRKLFVDDAVLMNLLTRLDGVEESERIAFRYVLGLILLRKKLLRYDGTTTRQAEQEEGPPIEQFWWKLTPKLDVTKGHFGKWNEDVTIDVLDPKLGEEAIGQVAGQLNEIFESEL